MYTFDTDEDFWNIILNFEFHSSEDLQNDFVNE